MTESSAAIVRITRLTPSGRGAVGVVVVEGSEAVEVVEKHFLPAAGKPFSEFPINRIVFGKWGANDEDGEEIVVCRTSDTSVELNCHGGIAASQAIMDALVSHGAVEQHTDSWAMQRADHAIQAEALLALGEARTERVAAILLDQYRGALCAAIEQIIDQLQSARTSDAIDVLAILIARGKIGLHLTQPWRVVFAGPPNVGKSSLMNRLLGFERSIVFDLPGTTRDLLTAPTAFDGWSVELTDTAGLRESHDAIESEGVSRATDCLDKADLVVLVFDASSDFGPEQENLISQHPGAIFVMNKCDLRDDTNEGNRCIQTSAVTGAGIDTLMSEIVGRLISCDIQEGDAIPFKSRQISAMETARHFVDSDDPMSAVESLRNILDKN